MITKERLIDLICSYAEGATDNVADGVLYNSLADAILLELQPNDAKHFVSGALPQLVERLEERINESDCGLDDVSWGMQEGILISVREAKQLVALLRQ